MGLLKKRVECAIDATGFESRYVSKHYVWRSGCRPYQMNKWPKLTAAIDIASHITLGIDRCMGPCQDSPQFAPTMRDAAQRQPLSLVLADKGYDSEASHRLCREELGADTTIIAVRKNTNGTKQWPKTRYRREMKRLSNREGYGQRWQVESGFSAQKRLLGTALRARTWVAQLAEMAIRVLTHNFMLCGNV